MRRWIRKEYTEQQKLRRENIVASLLPTHGCVPMDDYAEDVLDTLQSAAVAFGTLWESGQMPVLKYDDAFVEWRNDQIRENEKLVSERITCTLPWQVLNYLDASRKESDRLYWSQQSLGSCMGHADAFAHHSATLYWIARGAPLKYCPINPIVTWAIMKGGSLRGGLTVSEMAKGANQIGHFIERLVGTNNLAMPSNYKQYLDEALKYQSSIMFLNFRGDTLCDEIFACCAAGLSVAVGNSNAVSGSTIDKNGIKVATISSSWAHACGGENTCVYTTKGIKTYGELAGKHFHVLSWSHRLGRNTVKRASCIHGGKKPCVEVETNIGTFVMSYDHPFLTKDGFCVPASHLKEWQSSSDIESLQLFHGSARMDRQGYAVVPLYDGNNAKIRLHRLIGKDILGAGKNDIVHHIDENPLNNAFENLAVESRSEHSSHHWKPFSTASYAKGAIAMKERQCKTLTNIVLPQITWLSVDDVAFALGVCRTTIANKLRSMNAVPEKTENSRYYWSRATWFEMLSEMKFRQNCGHKSWHRPQDHYFGKRYIELPENMAKGVTVLSIRDCGDRDIYSIQVHDTEPDDKRPLTEHNYMICPVGANEKQYTSHGVFVANTSFTGYRKVNGTEYIGWVNSHGARYKSSDEGEPADMCWMDKTIGRKFCSTMHQYGPPYAVFPESVTVHDRSFYVKQQVPWPKNWRF